MQTLDIKDLKKAMDEKKQAITDCENKIDKLFEETAGGFTGKVQQQHLKDIVEVCL